MTDEVVRLEILEQIDRLDTEHHYLPTDANMDTIIIILRRIVQLMISDERITISEE